MREEVTTVSAFSVVTLILYGICAGRSHATYYRDKYGHTSGTAVPMEERRDIRYAVGAESVPGVLARCENAHTLYPYNYRLCTFASDVAFLASLDTADRDTAGQLRDTSWTWCERGLALNPLSRDLHLRKTGLLEETDISFADDEHLLQLIHRLVGRAGRRIDEVSPMVDAKLPDGSRLNAVIPPLALKGPTLSIRRFRTQALLFDDMVQMGSLAPDMATFLEMAVKGRLNILISGGTGAGKTTLLNNLSRYITNRERIVTIEQTSELQLQQPDVVSLEARPSNIEGQGEINQRELLKNSLRMRPDRIIVGESRGGEVLEMLQAMNTGHDGSMSTVHANDTRDALDRLELMIALSGAELPKRLPGGCWNTSRK